MVTVNEMLNQSLNTVRSLELTKIVGVFDQALYGQRLLRLHRHILTSLRRPSSSGLEYSTPCAHCWQLLGRDSRMLDCGICKSSVIADGSISGVMDGRKYNQAVRLHKLAYEALIRLAWKGFLSWLQANHTDDVVHMDETLKTTSNLYKDVSQASLKYVFQNMSCARIMYLFEVYFEFLRVGNGSLSTFWLSYLDMVEILLGLLRASREGHWILHLASIRAMIQ